MKVNITFFIIYSHVHTYFGSFLPAASLPHPLPIPTSLPGRTCSALTSNFVEEHNKKGKAFLLVEFRIATQRDS
jgi:hypothetical protein